MSYIQMLTVYVLIFAALGVSGSLFRMYASRWFKRRSQRKKQ